MHERKIGHLDWLEVDHWSQFDILQLTPDGSIITRGTFCLPVEAHEEVAQRELIKMEKADKPVQRSREVTLEEEDNASLVTSVLGGSVAGNSLQTVQSNVVLQQSIGYRLKRWLRTTLKREC